MNGGDVPKKKESFLEGVVVKDWFSIKILTDLKIACFNNSFLERYGQISWQFAN
jgi:hypothetical protein